MAQERCSATETIARQRFQPLSLGSFTHDQYAQRPSRIVHRCDRRDQVRHPFEWYQPRHYADHEVLRLYP